MCICSPRYPACNAQAPYCHLWPVRLYNINPHYLINGTTSKKKSYWTQNVCLDLSTSLSEIIFIPRTSEQGMIKTVYRSSCKVPIGLVRFQWNMYFLDRFSKNTKISKFIRSVQWESSFSTPTDGRTDRRREMMKLIAAVRNFANAPKSE